MAMSAGAHAATFTWSSSAGGTWDVPGNWGGMPLVTNGPATTLDFSTLTTSYTSTNNLTTSAASPMLLNRLIVGSRGTPTIAGAYLSFVGPNATIQRLTGGGTPVLNNATTISIDNALTLSGTSATDQITFGSKFTGSGGLVLNGLSAVITNNLSDFSGGVTLNAGELVVFADSGLVNGNLARGPLGTGTLTINGGTIRTNSANGRLLYNAVNVDGDFTFGSGSANTLTLAGQMTLSGTGTGRAITLAGSKTLVLAGAIGGTDKGLAFTGTGTAVIGGGAADATGNSFAVTTLNAAGVNLVFDKAAGTNAIGNLNYTAGTVSWNRAEQIADTATVSVAGGVLTFTADETIANLNQAAGAVRVNGGVNVTVKDSLNITGGTGPVIGGTLTVGGLSISRPTTGTSIYEAISANSGTLVTPNNTAGTLKLAGDVTLVASANAFGTRIRQGGPGGFLDLNGAQRTFNIGDGAAGEDLIISTAVIDSVGGAGFHKAGLGTLALTNDADVTVTGPSVIDAGRLAVYNYAAVPTIGLSAVGSGRLTINPAGTLGGNGKVAAVTVNGTIDPSVPSVANIGGQPNLTTPTLVVSSAVFNHGGVLKLDGVGGTNDQLIVNGLLDLSSTGDNLALSGVEPGSNVLLGTFVSIAGVFDRVTFNGTDLPSSYSIDYTGGQMTLAVPEPASLGLIVLAGGLITRPKRRATN
jgi:hypothetical protein